MKRSVFTGMVWLVPLIAALAPPAEAQSVSMDDDGSQSWLLVKGTAASVNLFSGDGNGTLLPFIRFEDQSEQSILGFNGQGGESKLTFLGPDLLQLIKAGGGDIPMTVPNGGLILSSAYPSQRYLADADDNDAAANHIWYQNKVGEPGDQIDYRMMQLTEESGGTLYVDGPIVQNHTFDLAETFWESETIAPGEVVAIDPERPNAVRRASSAYQETVLGVASTSPGFLLGGAPFSLADLEETWGRETVEEYLKQRRALEIEVFAEVPGLEAAAERIASEGSYLAYQEQAQRAAAGPDGQGIARQIEDPTPEELTAAYEAARHDFETTMFDRTLSRFFRERFSAVALAGRVPVKVDASFGPISPGDYLTSSPVPGVAMKARGPGPVVGTALEAHAGGEGVIEVFVHRGWYGGTGANVAGTALASRGGGTASKDRKIADLERRLTELERALAELIPSRLAERVESPQAP